MTMVPNIDKSLLKGTPNLLLSITYIDDDFISDIGHSLLLPDLALTSQPSQRRRSRLRSLSSVMTASRPDF